ncbi:hypothetical protein, partial [Rhodococcus qingshengii]|uniref:hypothetical protein n=1 Tax=Rhodococcus qingshengii TaxID=334542 RepID=UPI0039EA02E5
MSTVRFARRARRESPRTPGGEVTLQPPPEIPRVTPGNLLTKLIGLNRWTQHSRSGGCCGS